MGALRPPPARPAPPLGACDFEALHEPESNILCFRYRGDGSLDPEGLDRLNLRLREAYNRSGAGWITTTLLAGRPVLRVAVMNPRTSEGDVERTLDCWRRGRAPDVV
jgi:L-2,4-diaminobutyrate decarboxylase